MNLQNLTYTINNLSSRQKMAALAGIVGASAVISTIALSQRQSSRTTVNPVPNQSPLPVTASPLAPTTALPSPTGNLDATLAPGVVNSSSSTTTRFNSGIAPSPGSNLAPGVGNVAPSGRLQVGTGSTASSGLNSANPRLNNAASPNLTTAPQGRVFVPNVPSTTTVPASPVIPSVAIPTQDLAVPSAAPVPANPVTPQDNFDATSPADIPLPSSTEPTFDSRTGTYTTTPRATNSSPNSSSNSPTTSFGSPSSPTGSLGSPTSSSINNSRNPSDFNSNANFSRPSGGGNNNSSSSTSPVYGSSNGSSSSNPIYSNPNGNINPNSIYGSPNGGSTSNTSPNGTTTPSN